MSRHRLTTSKVALAGTAEAVSLIIEEEGEMEDFERQMILQMDEKRDAEARTERMIRTARVCSIRGRLRRSYIPTMSDPNCREQAMLDDIRFLLDERERLARKAGE